MSSIRIWDEWDVDEINLIDLDKLVRELGVKEEHKLRYVSQRQQLKVKLK